MTSLLPTQPRSSTFDRLADLPLVIESYSLTGLSRRWSPEFVRRTTEVVLYGAGEFGFGEDVSYAPEDHEVFQAAGAVLPLAGRYTLGSFSELLDEVAVFPRAPKRPDARPHRRWAFESAALDLALRQCGLSLAAALDRQAEPVSFVVSMRLPEPPSAEPVLRRLELYPDLRFKLDVSDSWNEALVRELAATQAVTSVDFKAYYEGLSLETASGAELYGLIAEGLPNVWLEDPALTVEIRRVLAPHMDRITWDAPIGSVEELTALDVRPQYVNVKPSRFGTLRGLLDVYDYLAAEGIRAYGGGQFELGPGRGQIQYLASLFHPEAPNDVAPLGFHGIAAGLPASPLTPAPARVGFRWEGDSD
jgi:L-alanine-DL-glutamate epimerase-like enolase superfamily enzyme